jgi:hypothetical protein
MIEFKRKSDNTIAQVSNHQPTMSLNRYQSLNAKESSCIRNDTINTKRLIHNFFFIQTASLEFIRNQIKY